MTKELEFREQAFLDYLFDGEQIRHPKEAKEMAGYPKDYPLTKILKSCNEELIKRCDNYLALYSPNAVISLVQLLMEPEIPGSKIKLQAIMEILDRSGVTKKEKIEVQPAQPNYVFVLPSKVNIEE